MTYILAAGFAALAVLYAVLDLSLPHWASVVALAFIALLLAGIGMHSRLVDVQRDLIEGPVS